LFSNFRSPEYIMALVSNMIVISNQLNSASDVSVLGSWLRCPDRSAVCSCPWHPGNPCHGISSQPAESPSSLDMEGGESGGK
uniref:Uncharacterized protein n=1 Tax=Myripristis murdjan TaxID=586833 RepID=A0A667WUQ2_9TELE